MLEFTEGKGSFPNPILYTVSVKIYFTELKSIAKRHTIFNMAREEVEEGSFLGVRQEFVIGFGTAVRCGDF